VQVILFPQSGQLMNHHTEISFHQIQLMQNGFHLVSTSQLAQTLYAPKNIRKDRHFFLAVHDILNKHVFHKTQTTVAP
jgi:predicted protein tyrosine phosphatase